MKIDYEKYKDIKIDKDKFKDIPTNVEQLRNCLAICYVLMEDKDKEIERLNNIIKELEKWLEEEIKNTKEIIKVCDDEEDRGIYLDKVYNYKDVLEKLKELKGSDKE